MGNELLFLEKPGRIAFGGLDFLKVKEFQKLFMSYRRMPHIAAVLRASEQIARKRKSQRIQTSSTIEVRFQYCNLRKQPTTNPTSYKTLLDKRSKIRREK